MAIDRSKRLTFYYDGRPITAFEGQSIGGALYAAGVRVFSRSFKYHRPRGLMCCAGRCPNCMMNVDGVPNIRVCVEPARDGARVIAQNAWPSVERDALGVFDRIDRLLPPGFYYKTFIRPRRLWPLYERVLRNVAGLGVVDPEGGRGHNRREYRYCDVAVIGGGPSGLAAALAADEAGLDVVLVDEQPELGGHLRTQSRVYDAPSEHAGKSGAEVAAALRERVAASGVTAIASAVAFGVYEGNLIGVRRGEDMIELRTRQTVYATGRFERPLVFEKNDLPGVMLGSGALRLLRLDGVRPGRRALVVSGSDEGLALALELDAAGINVAAVADLRAAIPSTLPVAQRLVASGITLMTGHAIKEARGSDHVTGATLVRLDPAGEPIDGSEVQIYCDLILVSAGFEVASSLLYQAGCTFAYDQRLDHYTVQTLGPDTHAAGEVTGATDLAELLAQGRAAGQRAAAALLPDRAELRAAADQSDRELGQLRAARATHAQCRDLAAVGHESGRKKFVCVCEDITEKDIAYAVEEGFDHVETLKRYTTFTMGPCQGKMCALGTIKLAARETGQSIEEVGTTTARPPYHPVSLGALAGPHHDPYKLTPMHQRHVALGAQLMDTGEWKRPRWYRSAPDEVRGVRQRVGLIDVGTLGKLIVQGKDAVALLEKVFTNKVADLREGRVRYVVVCDDAGIILDDGTIARMGPNRFFVTTTSTGANAVEEWLGWWTAGTGMCAHVTNVTAGYAAVNLAGPRARDVLARLTTADLSNRALPYLAARQLEVAGIPATCLRIGFVGELGYEMHVPAEHGEHVWDALMEAGREFDIVPFGVEAQRVLRLEKAHVIVTQDTDALSNPLESDMPWVVKFDKPDFIGKGSLQRVEREGLRNKLVGFEMLESTAVPDEGCQVVVGGRPAGRVTSARHSPTLGKPIGLAWVPIAFSQPGSPFTIRLDGEDVMARVVPVPFYDPEGARMRSDEPAAATATFRGVTPPARPGPFQSQLQQARATMGEADGWQLAESFAGAERELEAARTGVALADASASGKLELRGDDLARFLEGLVGADAASGRGLVGTAEIAGARATIARIADDHALLVVPAGSLEAVRGAVEERLADAGCVHLVDLTSTLAGLTLAGPRARDLLVHLTSTDLRDSAVGEGACVALGIARIPATLLRCAAGGVPTYTIYCTRDYAAYLWEVVDEAGHGLGLAPMGARAWRTLEGDAPAAD